MTTYKTLSEQQFLVKLSTLPIYLWQSATEPKFKRTQVEYNDAATGLGRNHLSFGKYENVTLGKHYDPTTDDSIITWQLAQETTATPFNVTYQPVIADRRGTLYPQGKPITLLNCQLVGFELPKVDRESTKLSMLMLEICFDDLRMS